MKIGVQELCKSFGGIDIFKNFSLDIESGQRLCVCGSNGAGKSTFLRMLVGREQPDAGKINLPKDCRIGFVEQDLSENELNSSLLEFTLGDAHDWKNFWAKWEIACRENSPRLSELMERQANLEQAYGYNPELRAKEALSGLGFSASKFNVKLNQLSGGWRERAKLAKALATGADLLLLHEPTNHLDLDAVEWLESFLLSYQGILAFVAHDRVFMDKIASHILWLGFSKPVFRKGIYTQFLAFQEEQERQKEREAKAIQEDINKKIAFIDRFRAKASKARQAGSRQKMAKKLEKQLDGIKITSKQKVLEFKWPKPPHCEKAVATVENLTFSYPDGHSMWPALTFTLYRDSQAALLGRNGAGKSTLLKLLAGKLAKTGGTISIAPQARVGYYSQHQQETLHNNFTVLAEIRRLSDPRLQEEELMSVLGLFMLGQNYFDRSVSNLSGGEKSRLLLASLFLKKCNFLILDEPANHLDLESREALLRALRLYNGTLLLVAHDRWLLSELGLEIWGLDAGGISVYPDFHAWQNAKNSDIEIERKQERVAATSVSQRDDIKKAQREKTEKRIALNRKLKPLRERLEVLEKKLDAMLDRQSEIEKSLAEHEVYADQSMTSQLLKEFEECRTSSEAIINEMDTLEQKISERITEAEKKF